MSAPASGSGVFFQDRLKPDIVRAQAAGRRRCAGPADSRATARVKWYRPPEYYAQSRWRGTWALDGGGALMNQGIHRSICCCGCSAMSPRCRPHRGLAHAIEVEDTALAVLEFASGALGTLQASTAVYPGYARRIELTGTEGTLVLDGDRLSAADLKQTLREALTPVAGARVLGGFTDRGRRQRSSGGHRGLPPARSKPAVAHAATAAKDGEA